MNRARATRLELPGPDATDRLGERMCRCAARAAEGAPNGILITLDGPLGAGKSSLARAFLRAFGITGPIPSPTFTLVEPYEAAGLNFFHLDLYRLADAGELTLLGYDEMRVRNAIVLVEWANRLPGLAAGADVAVELGYAGDGRWGEISVLDEVAWQTLLA